ncbi:hypothetical protein F6A13_03520 [Acidithiobacillus sp. 'AMD consortium']|uniref:hypothetical protein n=1 Tax=Acidithiobacillus sp. 'AMD consortium' TaxID=2614801 RepID=UPI00124DC8F6|nr:hypothetical protein [Acidithiobacillus sp. 'AMD consortium']QFG77805.1 hypothetical protein F6A13_03520 [Acidithiobacillus sp. 'AMD consortium']
MNNTPLHQVTPDLVVFAPKSYKSFVRAEMANAERENRWYKLDIRVSGVDNADNITASAALICADFTPKQIAHICDKLPEDIPIFLQGENGFFLEVVILETGKPVLIHPLSDESKYFRGDYVDQVDDLISILLEGVDHE